ncbi:MAG: 4-hydroxythreonine-4-phosphate dehydrogenase PdxA [Candidatus Altiarchaeota archaeon]
MLPKIGITIGDPAGIGSEITAKMLTYENVTKMCTPIIIGDAKVVQQGFDVIKSSVKFEKIRDVDERISPGRVYVCDLDNISPSDYTFGQISSKAGKAAGEYIEKAIQLALEKKIDAIVTNPINKEAFVLGGYGKKYAGHTEMLAGLTGTKKYSMMLAHGNLRVLHVTTHVSLLDAITKYIKKDRIIDVIKLANSTCKQLNIKEPKIGVAGLNPHSGEGGAFGDEEIKEISPAVTEAQKLGIKAEGPVPADTLFSKAKGGMYDAVVAMYHDQGHIPTKVLGFIYNEDSRSWVMKGVNITLGLPIIRTSVDHGTAFGKAGKGTADYGSLFDALKYAILLAEGKSK